MSIEIECTGSIDDWDIERAITDVLENMEYVDEGDIQNMISSEVSQSYDDALDTLTESLQLNSCGEVHRFVKALVGCMRELGYAVPGIFADPKTKAKIVPDTNGVTMVDGCETAHGTMASCPTPDNCGCPNDTETCIADEVVPAETE